MLEAKKGLEVLDKENIMDTKTKIILAVIAVCIVAVMAYTIKVQRDMIAGLAQNSTEQRQLKDNIAAMQASLLSKDEFNRRLESMNMDLSTIKSDLSKTNSTITSLLTIVNTTPGGTNTNVPNTGFYPIPTTNPINPVVPNPISPAALACKDAGKDCVLDQFSYYNKLPYLKLDEPTKTKDTIPFGEVSFDATKQSPWSTKVYARTYTTSIVLATDPQGRKTAYAKMNIKSNDKSIDLPETQIQFAETLPFSKFFWWNPRILFGLDAGMTQKASFSYGPTLQAFFVGYGQYSFKPKWFIGGVGINYDIHNANYNVAISPFMYNIGSNDSIIQNVSVGPTINVDFTGIMSIMGGARLSL